MRHTPFRFPSSRAASSHRLRPGRHRAPRRPCTSPLAFTSGCVNDAFRWLCDRRHRFPANADVWHLRFHWQTERVRILNSLTAGTYRLSALSLVRRADGTRVAIWSAADALVLKCLALALEKILPVSNLCEHVRGHGGGKASVLNTHRHLTVGRYPFVCRTDIRGYYGQIDKDTLYRQLCGHVRDKRVRRLLWQFLHYSVEDGGTFHTPAKGIPRGSALSPLLGAFHLTTLDRSFEGSRTVTYARYMDDFLVFAPTRWHLRKSVRRLNRALSAFGFEQHPDKTFIGRTEKGFDWMGVWFTKKGATTVAPRAVTNFLTKLRRLYEQVRSQHHRVRLARMAQYVRRWAIWVRQLLGWVPRSIQPYRGLQSIPIVYSPIKIEWTLGPLS